MATNGERATEAKVEESQLRGEARVKGSASLRKASQRESGAPQAEGLIKIDGVDFILISAAEYMRLGGDVSRLDDTPRRLGQRGPVAKRLYGARRHAGLTQAELAKRLGRSQGWVSQAESGAAHVGDRYVRAVLKACGLRSSWGRPRANAEDAANPELGPQDFAGLDPETLQLVVRGSKRDLELRKKYFWWSNCG
jgi:transcriptional regulator with XRE-family HTH domain